MESAASSDVKFEIGHVLFIDIVGYSKLLINEQSDQIQKLKEIVRGTEQVQLAESEGKLLRLPTGDGGALVFRTSSEAPVLCALEINKELRKHPELRVRMGIHSGPVNEVTDLNAQANIAGAGINIAQRVMDCGDPGHVLLSRHVAEDLEHYPRWQPYLHDLGECEVKHGHKISVVNLYHDDFGNPEAPEKFRVKDIRAAPAAAALDVKRVQGPRTLIAAVVILAAVGAAAGYYIFSHRSVAKAIPEKSIAVLPFENLSDDKANAYFADGIQDEILTKLASVADLKVISRTSTQRFKSAPSDLREIAAKLGVANILEGSVQKSGDAVRVTAQLINATNDSHLWAETYDRKLIDVFGVESDIAQKIASSLEAKLTGGEKEAIASVGTKNAQAYEFYLRGLSQRNKSSEPDTWKRIENYRRAVELDPNYADAWAQLAIEQAFIYRSPVQSEELGNNARLAAENALRLAPDSPQAHQAMGSYYGFCSDQYQAALRELEMAHERAPNDGAILGDLGLFQRANGKVDEAVATMQKAAELDPLNLNVWKFLASTYHGLRRFADARAVLERALALEPNDMDVIGGIAVNYQGEGNLDAAWKILSPYPFQTPTEWAFVPYYVQYLFWRDYGFLIETIKGMNLGGSDYPPLIKAANDVFLANLYFLNQQRDLAVSHAQKAEQEMRELREKKIILYELSANYIQMAAGAGNRAEMQREIDYVFAKMGDNKWLLPAAESWAAAGYALLGDLDKALPLLQDSLVKPNGVTTANLRLDPAWDRARNDPRFQKLCQEKEP